MINYRKYGPVLISAGLFVTGIGLWLFRGGVRGELQAECVAGLWERENVVRCYGTNAPSPFVQGFDYVCGTNYVTNLYSDVTIELHHEIDGTDATTWTTNTIRFLESDYGSFKASSFVIGPGAGTNYVSHWIVRRDGVDQNGSGTYLSCYRSDSSSQVLWHYGPDVYFYYRDYCRPTGVVGTVNFKLLSPPSQVLSVTTNIYPAGSVAVDDYLRWAPVQAMLDGYRRAALDECGSCSYLTSMFWTPLPCASWTNGTVIATIPQAWTNWMTEIDYLYYWSADDEPHTNRYWTTVDADGPAVDHVAAVGTRWPYDGVTWQDGLERTNTPAWLAVQGACNSDKEGVPSDTVIAAGSWWQNVGLGSDGYVYGHERAVTNVSDPAWTNVQKWVSTNLFLRARRVATNLYTTVWVGSPSEIIGTNITRTWYDLTSTSYVADVYDEDCRETEPKAASELPMALTACETNVGEMACLAATCRGDSSVNHLLHHYLFWKGEDPPCPEPGSGWVWSMERQIDATQYLGMVAPHPSEYACASGLVSRVRVFLAVRHFNNAESDFAYHNGWWGFGGMLPPSNEYYNVDERTRGTNGTVCGYAATACRYADTPSGAAGKYETDAYTQGLYPSEIRLHLVADVENPTTRPVWSWGTNDLSGGLPWGANWYVNAWTHGGESYFYSGDDILLYIYELTERIWESSVDEYAYVLFVAVVTDWNFQHMTGGYTPTNYTPAWARQE